MIISNFINNANLNYMFFKKSASEKVDSKKVSIKNGYSPSFSNCYMNKNLLNLSFKGDILLGPKTQMPLEEVKKELNNLLLEIVSEENDDKKLELFEKSVDTARKPINAWYEENIKHLNDSEKELLGDFHHELYNNFAFPYVNYISMISSNDKPYFSSVDKLSVKVFKDFIKTTNRYKFFMETGLTKHSKNLAQMVKLVLKPEKSSLKRRNIKVKLEGKEVLFNQKIKFRLNDYETYIILRNITQNASKYSPENTTIKFKLNLDKKNSLLNICVEDQGIGINPDEIEKTKEGKRASNAIKSGIPGSGQGLRRVVNLLDKVNQKIKIESPINPENKDYPGTKMSFSLPVIIED